MFRAIVFAVFDCGFLARCSLEVDDGSQNRLEKLFQIMSQCRIGVHDLSRIELDTATRLPRFNMALELGIFLGAKQFGAGKHRRKSCLVLDSSPYRYRKFISDIAGQDISFHKNSPKLVVGKVRDFLSNAERTFSIPGGAKIYARYLAFTQDIPLLCRELQLSQNALIFSDYVRLISANRMRGTCFLDPR